jgi:hypothetical protein
MTAMAAVWIFTLIPCVVEAQSKPLVKDIDIKMKFVDSPQMSAGNVSPYSDNKTKWLNIEVTYTTEAVKNKESGNNEWLDDISIQYEILVPESSYRGKKVPALLSGTVKYWTVEMNGDKHYAEAFVHPSFLKRYFDPNMKLRGNTADKIFARVTFYNKERLPIAREFNVPKGMTKERIQSLFKASEESLGVLRVENVVFSRNKTPWGVLNTDRYEVIKEETK